LFVLDFVRPIACAGIGFELAQAVGVTAQCVEQLAGVAAGSAHQGLRQGGWDFTADRGVGEGFQQRQATEVPGDVAVTQETCEEFLEGKFHGWCPFGQPGNRRAGRSTPLPPEQSAKQGLARRSRMTGVSMGGGHDKKSKPRTVQRR
jgi:hypothetical protein